MTNFTQCSPQSPEDGEAVSPSHTFSPCSQYAIHQSLAAFLCLPVDKPLPEILHADENRSRLSALAHDHGLASPFQLVQENAKMIADLERVHGAHGIPLLKEYCKLISTSSVDMYMYVYA
jgi:hypothetical protein